MDRAIINQPRVHRYSKIYQTTKRVVDIVFSVLAMGLGFPILVACAIAIRLDSAGPILFVQERIGKDGRRFNIFKFRTMQHDLDDSRHRAFVKAFVNGKIGNEADRSQDNHVESGLDATDGLFKTASPRQQSDSKAQQVNIPIQEPQVTRVGRILRKTSLDELPQILNVVRGEMSLVGPRPNLPWEVEEYKSWYRERQSVLPGITGLAQVNGRSSISFDRIAQYDLEYIETRSLLTDLEIMWRTVWVVIQGD
jgi:lipopolysaccharide/colanic/teichoic acid biosynthesis glycosyltransferase